MKLTLSHIPVVLTASAWFAPGNAFVRNKPGAVGSPILQSFSHLQRLPTNTPATTTKTCLYDSRGQYVKDAMDLFGNMNFPASIIAGAIIPLGYVAPLSIESEPGDSIWEKRARRMYQVLSVVTLTTELLAVMWATVAANQLTENTFLPANSVWHLIRRDFELEWAAVNAHFVVGMFGFLGMIGTRAYFIAKRGALGKSSLGVALSGLALMVSIVNRGVAAGGGTTGMRFGGTVLALGKRYATLLVSRAFSLKTFGILECVSVTALVVSLGVAVKEAWQVDVEE